ACVNSTGISPYTSSYIVALRRPHLRRHTNGCSPCPLAPRRDHVAPRRVSRRYHVGTDSSAGALDAGQRALSAGRHTSLAHHSHSQRPLTDLPWAHAHVCLPLRVR